MSAIEPFIGADELADVLESGAEDVVVLDVRFDPHHPEAGRPGWEAGHIPGSIYVDLPTELQAPPVRGLGRRPLPEIGALQDTVRSWGIDNDSRVVLYDDRFGVSAGRGWWVLRWAGLDRVQLLDGGIDAWTASGRPLVVGPAPLRAASDVVLSAGHLPVLDTDGAAAIASDGVLFDARDSGEYEKGHIPAAVSAPARSLLDAAGQVPQTDALRQIFAERGLTAGATVGTYCGGGVAGAFTVALLERAGIRAALYPGSWSQWSTLPDRRVVAGPTPDGP